MVNDSFIDWHCGYTFTSKVWYVLGSWLTHIFLLWLLLESSHLLPRCWIFFNAQIPQKLKENQNSPNLTPSNILHSSCITPKYSSTRQHMPKENSRHSCFPLRSILVCHDTFHVSCLVWNALCRSPRVKPFQLESGVCNMTVRTSGGDDRLAGYLTAGPLPDKCLTHRPRWQVSSVCKFNPFALRVPLESIVCYSHTFEIT